MSSSEQLCETCTRVKQIFGYIHVVAPWLCKCPRTSPQSSDAEGVPSAQQTMKLSAGSYTDQIYHWSNRPGSHKIRKSVSFVTQKD